MEGSPQERPAVSPARRLSLEVLLERSKAHVYVEEALRAACKREGLGDADRRLAFEIVLGTTKRRLTIEHLVAGISGIPRRRLQREVLINLEVAFYQVLFLERVPDHAVVNEAVELAKQWGRPQARFTNAVLRKLADAFRFETGRDPLKTDARTFAVSPDRCARFTGKMFADPARNPVGHLSQVFSLPPWLIARWAKRFSEPTARKIAAIANDPPPVFLRVDTGVIAFAEAEALLAREGFSCRKTPRGDALMLERSGDLSVIASKPGLFVQDLSSMEAVDAMEAKPGDSVLDLCAGPGTKTAQIACRLGEEGFLVAADVDEGRLELVRDNLAKARFKGYDVLAADGREIASLMTKKFDRVLVDAPCTNTGVLRRRAEARWRVNEESLEVLSSLQSQLLAAGFEVLAPRGRLLYCTCSIEREENEHVIERFLRATEDGRLIRERFRLPERHRGDGGYFAVIERKG